LLLLLLLLLLQVCPDALLDDGLLDFTLWTGESVTSEVRPAAQQRLCFRDRETCIVLLQMRVALHAPCSEACQQTSQAAADTLAVGGDAQAP
jgi:hypothetical protein